MPTRGARLSGRSRTGYTPPRDAEGLTDACVDAESKLGACRTELLTVAAQWDQGALALSGSQGPHSLRKGAMQSMKNISSKQDTHEHRRARLDTALKSVREAEALSQKMLERQRLLDEARREFQAALDAASERLAIIPVEQFIIQGHSRRARRGGRGARRHLRGPEDAARF